MRQKSLQQAAATKLLGGAGGAGPELSNAAARAAGQRPRKVLIIEHDAQSVRSLESGLARAGFAVTTVDSSADARAAIELDCLHLVMLDWDLPSLLRMDLVRLIKRGVVARGPRLIALSKFSGEDQVVSGFESGADDYVVKPFSVAEVVARARAVVRTLRRAEEHQDRLEFRQLQLDTAQGRATVRGRPVNLRGMEFRLLEFLMRNPERAFNRETLLRRVWGLDETVGTRAVNVTVQRLRQALAPHECAGYVQSVRGIGYMLSGSSSG